MKGLWKERRTAVIVAVIVVVCAIPYGGHRSMLAAAEPIEKVFYQGAERDGIGIQSELSERVGQANNLLVVAKRYVDETLDVYQNLQMAKDSLEKANTITEKHDANEQLTVAAEAMFLALGDHLLTDSDQNYSERIRVELNASSQQMAHDEYNTMAEKYNKQVLSKFPANILKEICFVDELETFR